MNFYEYDDREDQANELAEKIIKRYKNYGVNINIKEKGTTIFQDRFQFRIKLLSSILRL